MAGHTESYTPLQYHSPGEAAMDASYCFFSLPKQIQLGLELHCPIRRRIIHFTPNTPMGLSILITVTTGSQGWETVNQNFSNPLRHTLLLYSRSQSLWLAYHKAREVLKLGRGQPHVPPVLGRHLPRWESHLHLGKLRAKEKKDFLGELACKSHPTVTGEMKTSLQDFNNAVTQKELYWIPFSLLGSTSPVHGIIFMQKKISHLANL